MLRFLNISGNILQQLKLFQQYFDNVFKLNIGVNKCNIEYCSCY